MQAVLATAQGAVVRDIPMPQPGKGQILVQVHTAGLNRADLRTLAVAKEDVIGMEWVGVVKEVGEGVTGFKPGDKVMCAGKAAFAEYAVADAGRSALIPEGLDMRQAGSLMLALHTAHDAVVTHGQVQPGDAVLVHGAASGVGMMTARIARSAGAKLVIGTSRNPSRRAALLEQGFDVVLDPTDPGWTQAVLEATGGGKEGSGGTGGVNAVIDFVAGPQFNDLIKVSAILGRIVNVGRLGGATGPFDFETHALKRLTYTGVTFRTRSAQEISEINEKMLHDLGPALGRGELGLPLDEDFALSEAQQAMDRMKADQHFGKITLRVAG